MLDTITEVSSPSFEIKSSQSLGLSGFMRVKNEQECIYESISSWLRLVDELVVVYNDCSDNTDKEILRAIKDFPGKIKAYAYIPKVYPPNSNKYLELDSNHPQSLVFYYNFALSKTSYDLCVKVDADLIYDASFNEEINSKLKDIRSKNLTLGLRGINLIDNFNSLYVPSFSMFCGGVDLCIFKKSEKTIFKKTNFYEILDLSFYKPLDAITCYYHLKFIKKDFGIAVYELDINKNSRYASISRDFIYKIRFLDIKEVIKANNLKLKLPEELNIKAFYNRDYVKLYCLELKKLGLQINIFYKLQRKLSALKLKTKIENLKQKIKAFIKSKI